MTQAALAPLASLTASPKTCWPISRKHPFSCSWSGDWKPSHSGPFRRKVPWATFSVGTHRHRGVCSGLWARYPQRPLLGEANGVVFYLLPQVAIVKNLAIKTGSSGSNVLPYKLIFSIYYGQQDQGSESLIVCAPSSSGTPHWDMFALQGPNGVGDVPSVP